MHFFHGRKTVWLMIIALMLVLSVSSCRCRRRPPKPQLHPAAINPDATQEMKDKCTASCKNYCLNMRQCKGGDFKTALCGNACLWMCTRGGDQEVQKCTTLGGNCESLLACSENLRKLFKEKRQESAPPPEAPADAVEPSLD